MLFFLIPYLPTSTTKCLKNENSFQFSGAISKRPCAEFGLFSARSGSTIGRPRLCTQSHARSFCGCADADSTGYQAQGYRRRSAERGGHARTALEPREPLAVAKLSFRVRPECGYTRRLFTARLPSDACVRAGPDIIYGDR